MTPLRRKQLVAYIACLRKAERRIVLAGHKAYGCVYQSEYKFANSFRVIHAAKLIKERTFDKYAEAYHKLQYTRSRMQCELDGQQWQM
jgi:hypothetical protein